VPKEQIRRGAVLEDGRLVLIDPKELGALQPESSRSIEVVGFAAPDLVAPAYYERPYDLVPDGPAGPYLALAGALEDEEAIALVRWVMRKRPYRGVLRAEAGRLGVVTLRPGDEVLALPSVEPSASRAPGKQEIEIAEQLVDALAGPFEPDAYHDTYREKVVALAEKKARGEKVRLPRAKPRKAPRSLEAALKASVRAAKEKKVA
jgi:DNA end-binding protein Ku